jgi:hypothetical protein
MIPCGLKRLSFETDKNNIGLSRSAVSRTIFIPNDDMRLRLERLNKETL